MQFGRKSTQKKWIVQIKTYKNAFFEKKITIFLVNSKKSSTFAAHFVLCALVRTCEWTRKNHY